MTACLFSEVAYDIKADINNSRIVKYNVEVCCLIPAMFLQVLYFWVNVIKVKI